MSANRTVTPPGKRRLIIRVYRNNFLPVLLFLLFSIGISAAVDDSIHLYQQGLEALKAGNYRSAELLFSKVIKKDDAMRDNAWFALAKSLYYQKKYTSAVFEYNRFIVMSTDDRMRNESYFWIADSHYMNGEHILAIEEFKRFINETSGFPELKALSYTRIAAVYSAQNRYEEALLELNYALELAPGEAQKRVILYSIAEMHFFNENYPQALEKINQLLSPALADDVDDSARILSARIALSEGKNREALGILDVFDDDHILQKKLFDVHYFRANASFSLNDDRAIADYALYFDNAPDGSYARESQFKTGTYLFARARYVEALPCFIFVAEQATLAERPLRDDSLYYAAFILFLAKDYSKARVYLDVIPEEEMNYANKEYFLLKSDNYVAMGLYQFSVKLLLKMRDSYRYDPELDRILYKLAFSQLQAGEYNRSRETFETIRKIDPFSEYIAELPYYIALGFYEQGDNARAIAPLSSYLSSSSAKKNELDALFRYSQALNSVGRYSDSEKTLRRMIAKYPVNEMTAQAVHSYVLKRGIESDSYLFGYIYRNFPFTYFSYDMLRIQAADRFSKKQYRAAFDIYSAIIKNYSQFSDDEDLYRYLVCQKELGNENELVDAIKTHSFSRQWNSDKFIPLLADVYEKRGNTDTALSLYTLSDDTYNEKMIIYLLENGNYDVAFRLFADMPDIRSKYILFLAVSEHMYRTQKFAMLIPYGELIVGKDEFASEKQIIEYELCRHSYACGDFERARKYLPPYHKDISGKALALRCALLFLDEKYELIMREYDFRIDDDRYHSLVLLSALKAGKLREAKSISLRLEKKKNKNRETLYALIQWYYHDGDTVALQRLITDIHDPYYYLANYHCAFIAYNKKDYLLFERFCTIAVDARSEDINVDKTLLLYSHYLLSKGDHMKASELAARVRSSADLSLRKEADTILGAIEKR